MLAYLIIRDGSKWSDVVRLVPGRTVTIGRAPTNQIVINEEQASRHHAEIFITEGNWTLRDLGSRNGSAIGSERIKGDRTLTPGDVIRIARTQMAFVHDLAAANSTFEKPEIGDETVAGLEVIPDENLSGTLDFVEPTTITHRREKTRFLAAPSHEEEVAIPKVGRAATRLCRLAFEMANLQSAEEVANVALNGILEGTNIDSGGILFAAPGIRDPKSISELQVLASRSDLKPSYRRVSSTLAETVLRDDKGIVVSDNPGDSKLIRDSQGIIQATSVVCAPIRVNSVPMGMVHLYSTDDSRVLDADDLEFAMAVAENIGIAFKTFRTQKHLTDDIRKKRAEIIKLREQLGVESEIVGSSPEMIKVHEEIARAAPSKATVLIRGENGVGKELVARAVHYSSARNKNAFVCLNCAALAETLLESELFGHEKGAFTGATEQKIGKFESADKGTLMLDEIGEMSLSIQAKFLRVLEGHPFERLGGNKAIKTNVRVIAATNRDLVKAVKEKKFRRDLYFRLNVVEIQVPPLRRRPSDVIEIAEHFLQRFNAETGRKVKAFAPATLEMMQAYAWPGNVRELKNVVERGVLFAQGNLIQPEDLSLSALNTASESQMDFGGNRGYRALSLADLEKEHIIATLRNTEWNKSRSANILGIERSTLDRKIKKYEIVRDS